MQNETPSCARCPFKASDRLCQKKDGKAPHFCPTRNLAELAEQSLKEYDKPSISEFAKQSSIQESEGYLNKDLGYENLRASKTRIEETMEFAARMHYKRLGIAFCLGLRNEAKVVEKIFLSRKFEVVSAICKVGRISKERIGVGKEHHIALDRAEEAMCNPILQAMILNTEKTDFNVLLGLCVGHDSLFLKYAEAPCTILAVKDRMLGHNPLAAVYNVNSYYRCLK
ncbi:conserved hypothetical protein [Desulfosarcina cetonica]|uniref:DUF1847 domain-containing protein n=1 Tax=Desulfosarcina cetonica TaxID=90730 RepID=UPI0006CFCED5|nr:DUF1847 domain-containing protein [Desulfosarcina cetonica]VTR68585.1 conserved hypothetical protein [Desulfosarcina cetonica]